MAGISDKEDEVSDKEDEVREEYRFEFDLDPETGEGDGPPPLSDLSVRYAANVGSVRGGRVKVTPEGPPGAGPQRFDGVLVEERDAHLDELTGGDE